MKLVIGDKQYSSWSVRGSLIMIEHGVPYEEILIGSDWPIKIKDGKAESFYDEKIYGFPVFGASGCCSEISQLEDAVGKDTIDASLVYKMHRVPVFYDEKTGVVLSDVLEINQYLEEQRIGTSLLSNDVKLRSSIRSLSNHLVSDYLISCGELSYGKSYYTPSSYKEIDSDVLKQIDEYIDIINDVLLKYEGEYLFGNFSLADIIVAPVAITLKGWQYPINAIVSKYFDILLNRDSIKKIYINSKEIYSNMTKYKVNSINWIANQFRYNEKYKYINLINHPIYHKIKNEKDFEAIMMAKEGLDIKVISRELSYSVAELEKLFAYINPVKMICE